MSTLAHLEPGSESITNFDRLIRARIGKQSLRLSPPGLMLVYLDWLVHLEFSPAKRLELLGIGLAVLAGVPLDRYGGPAFARPAGARLPASRRCARPLRPSDLSGPAWTLA